jgi:predicted amidohydrolase
MKPSRSISVAQTCPAPGDVSANLGEHLRLIELAASQKSQIVVFPELSLTGYEIGLADELAFSLHDARLAPLVDAAASRSITIVVGAPARIEAKLHIAAFVLSPDGATELYTKHHLGAFGEAACRDGVVPPAEATVFHPGDLDPRVRFGGNTAAIAICADIGRASHPQRAADRGAHAYLASMFVIPSELDADRRKLSRYAAQHSMAVALSNFGCRSGGLAAAGHSSIWSQTGELLAELPASGSGVASARETAEGWRAQTILLDGQSA